jgi:hypothetical protein
MAPATLRRILRTRWSAWLLAWALCLPVAQWASAAHALLHLKSVAAEERDSPAKMPVACDICVVAATLGAAAPGTPPPAFVAAPAPHAAPLATFAQAPALAFLPAYRSRAPPLLHA